MIKTNIKMRVTPEQSAKVQEICFENGIDWKSKLKDKTLTCINEPFIFVKEDKHLTWLTKLEESIFIEAKEKEIDPELFIRTNGSCMENLYKNNFKDYGFEGSFEGEILKEYEKHFVGMVYQNEGNFGCSWDKKGKCLQAKGFGYIDMDLKPIKNQEFTYPMWFKSKKWDYIVEFTDLRYGRVVKEGANPRIFKTFTTTGWTPHTDNNTWEQVENPNEHLDRSDNIVSECINKAKNPNSKHYELWENFEAIDVIKLALTNEEYKGFLKGNILKYQLRLGKKDDVSKEIEKIKDYQRELKNEN